MSILIGFSRVINVQIFGILSGFALTALGIVSAINLLRPKIADTLNKYFAFGYFFSSFVFFICGLLLAVFFSSLGHKYNHHLTFEIINVIFTGSPLLIGLFLLLGGVDALAKVTIGRGLVGFPRSWKWLITFLEIILPTKKVRETSTVEVDPNPKSDDIRTDVGGKLADQSKTVFVVGLLTLSFGIPNSISVQQINRDPWWYFLIGTVVLLVIYGIWGWKRLTNKIIRWIFPFVIMGVMFLTWWISGSGNPVPVQWYTIIASALIIWAVVLFIILFLFLSKLLNGKFYNIVHGVVIFGHYACFLLTIVALLNSVLTSWGKLRNSGIMGWWMDPLLCIGILMAFIVPVYAFNLALSKK
jgi:hypothetical protein